MPQKKSGKGKKYGKDRNEITSTPSTNANAFNSLKNPHSSNNAQFNLQTGVPFWYVRACTYKTADSTKATGQKVYEDLYPNAAKIWGEYARIFFLAENWKSSDSKGFPVIEVMDNRFNNIGSEIKNVPIYQLSDRAQEFLNFGCTKNSFSIFYVKGETLGSGQNGQWYRINDPYAPGGSRHAIVIADESPSEILAHELGHALGLPHTANLRDDLANIMNSILLIGAGIDYHLNLRQCEIAQLSPYLYPAGK